MKCISTLLCTILRWVSTYASHHFHFEAGLIDHLFPEIQAKPCHVFMWAMGPNMREFNIEFVSV